MDFEMWGQASKFFTPPPLFFLYRLNPLKVRIGASNLFLNLVTLLASHPSAVNLPLCKMKTFDSHFYGRNKALEIKRGTLL